MVKIRLRRMGAKKAPFYRVVVADSRFPRDGRFIEEIGTYNPCVSPAAIKIDAERAQAWIKSGAQPTDTVTVTETASGNQELTLELRVAPDDMGKVIGRQGRIAKEIRTLVRSRAQREGVKVSVDIMD